MKESESERVRVRAMSEIFMRRFRVTFPVTFPVTFHVTFYETFHVTFYETFHVTFSCGIYSSPRNKMKIPNFKKSNKQKQAKTTKKPNKKKKTNENIPKQRKTN